MNLREKILALASKQPEGTPLAAQSLARFGSRNAIDQALSRLAKEGVLLRAGRGLYVSPQHGKFGSRPPEPRKVVEAIAAQSGETVVPNEAAAANLLGLTTQVPVRQVYLTSGKSRRLKLGGQVVEMKHAPKWKIALGNRPAGLALRALSWAGEKNAHAVAKQLKERLSPAQIAELSGAHTPYMPSWMAQEIRAMSQHA